MKRDSKQKPDHAQGSGTVKSSGIAAKKGARLYCLCVHYGLRENVEWEWRGQHLMIYTNRVLDRLTKDIVYLRDVLKPCRAKSGHMWQGFAFVFLDPGWTTLIKGGHAFVTAALLGHDLRYAQSAIERGIEDKVPAPRRSRIITAARLIDLLVILQAQAGGAQATAKPSKFFELLAGKANALRYDAPKVVEAAIRIANIGRQVPIFRFDDDVIFSGQRKYPKNLKKRKDAASRTRANILQSCDRYTRLSLDSAVHYFVYSGSYAQPTGLHEHSPPPKSDRVNDRRLINGFATRVVQLSYLPRSNNVNLSDEARVSLRKARKFLQTLYRMGANPFRQVISGAGLCLSDSAILDLPPFSNMHLNVMWIDDHLKYALHDELGHFGIRRRMHHHARMLDTRFEQKRPPPTYENVRWHLQQYMLRLLLGCVADSWLRQHANLKRSSEDLTEKEYKALGREVPGAYADEFLKSLPGGWEDKEKKPKFKEKLWVIAQKRLKMLVSMWGHHDYDNTFLGLFVKGNRHRRYGTFRSYLPVGFEQGLRVAVESMPNRYEDTQVKVAPDGSPLSLESAVKILVDDFIGYFDLWLFWPAFTQSVRFLLNRHAQIRSKDLDWMFPEE